MALSSGWVGGTVEGDPLGASELGPVAVLAPLMALDTATLDVHPAMAARTSTSPGVRAARPIRRRSTSTCRMVCPAEDAPHGPTWQPAPVGRIVTEMQPSLPLA
jgi:hypothetical protein